MFSKSSTGTSLTSFTVNKTSYNTFDFKDNGKGSPSFPRFHPNENSKFSIFFFFFEIILIILFGMFTDYSHKMNPLNKDDGEMGMYYPLFQDVHVMMFIGFGFLLSYLSKYSYSSIAFNFMLGAFVLQWSILNIGFWPLVVGNNPNNTESSGKIELDVQMLINADYCVAAVLISFGGVLGKFSPIQYLGMAFFEVIFYSINLYLCYNVFGAIDVGGSMYIHTFGAYFGLIIAFVFSKVFPECHSSTDNHSLYASDTFSLIGTIFLWMYWPSFNGALAVGGQQHRVIINTILSLCTSCVVTFCVSYYFHSGKFNMVEIQNATLAGGVAVGCAADLWITPAGAMGLGLIAGLISTFGFIYISPCLEKKIGLHDTAGIHNLHGMPGILGGLAGVFAPLVNPRNMYGTDVKNFFGTLPGGDRPTDVQAGYQMAALVITLTIALIGGLFTSFMLLLPCFSRVQQDKFFLDDVYWNVPDDYPGKPYVSSDDESPIESTKKRDSDNKIRSRTTSSSMTTATSSTLTGTLDPQE